MVTDPIVQVLYHVYSRGILRTRIFRDDRDFSTFLTLMSKLRKRHPVALVAYALMPNHIHLMVFGAETAISNFMQDLLAQYAQYFNWRYDRTGHLFESTFGRTFVYSRLLAVIMANYIHLNPVKARLCHKPEDYPWSSYRVYAGMEPNSNSLALELVSQIYATDPAGAPAWYVEQFSRRLVLLNHLQRRTEDAQKADRPRIREDSDFMPSMIVELQDAIMDAEPTRQLPERVRHAALLLLAKRLGLGTLSRIARILGIPPRTAGYRWKTAPDVLRDYPELLKLVNEIAPEGVSHKRRRHP